MLRLRSLNDNESAYVQFRNETNRNVDIVWINYVGDLQKFGTLKPGENLNIDTFVTHPWIFIDRQTGVKMRAAGGTIFYPSSKVQIMQRLGLNQELASSIRVPIWIQLPLFSLRQISLQSVINLLRDLKDIDVLELPQTLKRDIRKFCEEKNEIISRYER